MASALAMGSAGVLIELLQCFCALLNEKWKISLDGTPDDAIAHIEVVVGEQVAEDDDLAALRDLFEQLWSSLGDHPECFTDDDERALHRGADQTVAALMATAASRMSLR